MQDHPRLRGEHLKLLSSPAISKGSPPPTRGTPLCSLSKSIIARITPAYAGNTVAPSAVATIKWDHPRLRGEHTETALEAKADMGSPPPTRGTPCPLPVTLVVFGITPAYAGNTQIYVLFGLESRDHPRLRGEHSCKCCIVPLLTGSPPPTRGTPSPAGIVIAAIGITPAYAGNTPHDCGGI